MMINSKSMMSKLSVTLIFLISTLICSAQASCWRYGHSCWGGHGKRSGGKAAMAIDNSELLPSGDEELSKRQQRIPLELQPLQSMSSATFQGDGIGGRDNIELMSRSPKELYGSKFQSIFPYSSTNNHDSRDEVMEDKQQVDEEDDTAAPADYTQSQEQTEGQENDLTMDVARNKGNMPEADSSEIFIGIPRISSTNMKPLAIATSEDSIKRAVGDLSARKFPLENFNLYKLVRIVRRRK